MSREFRPLCERHGIAQAIDRNAANAALIKVNQIGTVSGTLEAMRLCRDAGWA